MDKPTKRTTAFQERMVSIMEQGLKHKIQGSKELREHSLDVFAAVAAYMISTAKFGHSTEEVDAEITEMLDKFQKLTDQECQVMCN